jgi:hypothetical protein
MCVCVHAVPLRQRCVYTGTVYMFVRVACVSPPTLSHAHPCVHAHIHLHAWGIADAGDGLRGGVRVGGGGVGSVQPVHRLAKLDRTTPYRLDRWTATVALRGDAAGTETVAWNNYLSIG